MVPIPSRGAKENTPVFVNNSIAGRETAMLIIIILIRLWRRII